MITLKNINKTYCQKRGNVEILKNINVSFESGNLYAIMGRSGSGKTTLVNILGLLDNASSGDYIIDGKNVANLSDDEKADLRSKYFGFIFQSFYLNPKLTAIENVMLPLYISNNLSKKDKENMASEYFNRFNIDGQKYNLPKELSGGEQQRVAIARALINTPEVIIADEPTGNLDSQNELEIFNILKEISKNKIVIVVTHNELIKQFANKVYYINDGNIGAANEN